MMGKYRAVLVSSNDVDLRGADGSVIFVMKIAEGSLASGGRGGGFGERRVVKVSKFRYEGAWTKAFETEEEATLAKFEVPHYVSRVPVTFADGTEGMGYGVVDPELVAEFSAKTGLNAGVP